MKSSLADRVARLRAAAARDPRVKTHLQAIERYIEQAERRVARA